MGDGYVLVQGVKIYGVKSTEEVKSNANGVNSYLGTRVQLNNGVSIFLSKNGAAENQKKEACILGDEKNGTSFYNVNDFDLKGTQKTDRIEIHGCRAGRIDTSNYMADGKVLKNNEFSKLLYSDKVTTLQDNDEIIVADTPDSKSDIHIIADKGDKINGTAVTKTTDSVYITDKKRNSQK